MVVHLADGYEISFRFVNTVALIALGLDETKQSLLMQQIVSYDLCQDVVALLLYDLPDGAGAEEGERGEGEPDLWYCWVDVVTVQKPGG